MFLTNRFRKLKRDDVVQSTLKLEEQMKSVEDRLRHVDVMIKELMIKGKKESSREVKTFHAKRIMQLQQEKSDLSHRGMYLLYNIRLLSKLKEVFDQQEFIKVTAKSSLIDLLADQKHLATFLNQALQTKIKHEDILTDADLIFNEVQTSYQENAEIYEPKQDEETLIAMFDDSNEIEEDIVIETSSLEEKTNENI